MSDPGAVRLQFEGHFPPVSGGQLFPDAALVCGDGTRHPCHRLVLSAHSECLRAALQAADEQQEDSAVLLLLPDFTSAEVDRLLRVMYGGSSSGLVCGSLVQALGLSPPGLLAAAEKSKSRVVLISRAEAGRQAAAAAEASGAVCSSVTVERKPSVPSRENIRQLVAAAAAGGRQRSKTSMTFECPECGSLFEALDLLYQHLEQCDQVVDSVGGSAGGPANQTLFKCSRCGQVFPNIDDINSHMEDKHLETVALKDPKQEADVDVSEDGAEIRLEEVEETIVTVGGEGSITVQKGEASLSLDDDKSESEPDDKATGNGDEPLKHNEVISCEVERTEDNGCSIRYLCNVCSEVFDEVERLDRHMELAHAAETEVRYQCNFCKEVFDTVAEHNSHTVEEHSQIITDQVSIHQAENYFKCSRCSSSFGVVRELTEHIIASHHEEASARKAKGGGGRSSKENVNTNLLEQLKSRCTYCLKTLNAKDELEAHYKTFHPGLDCDIYMCSHCNKIFRSLDYLQKHERVHQEVRPFQCGGCSAKFSLASALHNHAKKCQSIPINAMNKFLLPKKLVSPLSQVYKCTYCTAEFTSVNTLRKHENESCGERFKKVSISLRPILPKTNKMLLPSLAPSDCVVQIAIQNGQQAGQASHEATAVFDGATVAVLDGTAAGVLDTGDMVVAAEELQEQEVVSHEVYVPVLEGDGGGDVVGAVETATDVPMGKVPVRSRRRNDETGGRKGRDRKFVCEWCQNAYYARDHLMAHIRAHTGEKPFQCEKCQQNFMYRSTWANHRIKCIEGPEAQNRLRKFSCQFCQASFMARDHLRCHIRIHTGEKPWKCDKCGDSFQYRNRWKNHIRKCDNPLNSSPPNKPVGRGRFKCAECEQTFNKTSRLEKHYQQSHPGPKGFTCTRCEAGFFSKSGWLEHTERCQDAWMSSEEAAFNSDGQFEEQIPQQVEEEIIDTFQEQVIECETVIDDSFEAQAVAAEQAWPPDETAKVDLDSEEFNPKLPDIQTEIEEIRKSPRTRNKRKHEAVEDESEESREDNKRSVGSRKRS